jgi:serine/threonine-protein kinase
MNIVSQLGWRASTVEESSLLVPVGQVIRTEPPARSSLPPGSDVEIVVSTGLPMVAVPPVVSLLEATAVAELETAGFGVNVVYEPLPSNSPNDGRVITQSPLAAVEIDSGSFVTIVIGAAEAGDGAGGEPGEGVGGETGVDAGDGVGGETGVGDGTTADGATG